MAIDDQGHDLWRVHIDRYDPPQDHANVLAMGSAG